MPYLKQKTSRSSKATGSASSSHNSNMNPPIWMACSSRCLCRTCDSAYRLFSSVNKAIVAGAVGLLIQLLGSILGNTGAYQPSNHIHLILDIYKFRINGGVIRKCSLHQAAGFQGTFMVCVQLTQRGQKANLDVLVRIHIHELPVGSAVDVLGVVICIDLSNLRYVLVLIVLLFIIGYIFVRMDLYYENPTLALMGYRMYRADIEGVDAPDGVILIAKNRLSSGTSIKWIEIDAFIWVAKEVNIMTIEDLKAGIESVMNDSYSFPMGGALCYSLHVRKDAV